MKHTLKLYAYEHNTTWKTCKTSKNVSSPINLTKSHSSGTFPLFISFFVNECRFHSTLEHLASLLKRNKTF